MSELNKCTFVTAAGTRCKNNQVEGSEYCRMHKFQMEKRLASQQRASTPKIPEDPILNEESRVNETPVRIPKKSVLKQRGNLDCISTYCSPDSPQFYDSIEINVRTADHQDFTFVLASTFISSGSEEVFQYIKGNYVQNLIRTLGAMEYNELNGKPEVIQTAMMTCHENMQKYVDVNDRFESKDMSKYFVMVITSTHVVYVRNDTNIGVICNGEGEDGMLIIVGDETDKLTKGFHERASTFKFALITSDTLKNGESAVQTVADFILERQTLHGRQLTENPSKLLDAVDLIFLRVFQKKPERPIHQKTNPTKVMSKANTTNECREKLDEIQCRFLTKLYNDYSGNLNIMSKLHGFRDTVKAYAEEVVQCLRPFAVLNKDRPADLANMGRYVKLHIHDVIFKEMADLIDQDSLALIYSTRL